MGFLVGIIIMKKNHIVMSLVIGMGGLSGMGGMPGLAAAEGAGTISQPLDQLGQSLTPIGAERAGNGTDIPAWTGGLEQSQKREAGFHVDPYQTDIPVVRISAANMAAHQERLTLGQQTLLEKYPSLYLEVYPSRRSASYPDYVYDALKSNAAHSQLLPYGSGVNGTVMTSPFPIPENGLEVLWNHTLRFRGHSLSYSAVSSVVTESGQRMDTLRDYRMYVNYSEPGLVPHEVDNKIFMMTRKTLEPT